MIQYESLGLFWTSNLSSLSFWASEVQSKLICRQGTLILGEKYGLSLDSSIIFRGDSRIQINPEISHSLLNVILLPLLAKLRSLLELMLSWRMVGLLHQLGWIWLLWQLKGMLYLSLFLPAFTRYFGSLIGEYVQKHCKAAFVYVHVYKKCW